MLSLSLTTILTFRHPSRPASTGGGNLASVMSVSFDSVLSLLPALLSFCKSYLSDVSIVAHPYLPCQYLFLLLLGNFYEQVFWYIANLVTVLSRNVILVLVLKRDIVLRKRGNG